MRVAFITRSTIHDVPGGDTVQVMQTARHLRELGMDVDICLTNSAIDYSRYEVLHFSNIFRPSDILFHIGKTKKPFALSPILIDYSEFDRSHRKGISGYVLRHFRANTNEYIKTLSRWIMGADSLQSRSYLWRGQRKSIRKVLRQASILLPNSEKEYGRLKELYHQERPYSVVPNGIDPSLFHRDKNIVKDDKLVICAARIEGLKNQLNLIKALNDTSYKLIIIGSPAPNQKNYYDECRAIASTNVTFHERLPQDQLVDYYQRAKVHALPSWFETCGLSSLEAAVMDCNVVITEKGFTREYFGDDAFYADPGDSASILDAVERAAKAEFRGELKEKILEKYTWKRAAAITAEAYRKIISN